MQEFVTTLFNGLSLSSIILLTSLGLAITFGLMRVINMAHGEFVMIGAYMTYVTQEVFAAFLPAGVQDLYYIAALPLAFAVTFLLGALLERVVVSRLYGREIDSLLATWGISLILQQAARSIFGAQGVNVNAPAFLSGGLTIGGCTFSYNRLFILGLVLVCLVGVGVLMYRTAFGRQVRAVMQNRPMAQCMGINSRRVDCLTFSLGSGLAGLAGCSIALLGSIDATVGAELHCQLVYGRCVGRRWPSAGHRGWFDRDRRVEHLCRKLHFRNDCKGNCAAAGDCIPAKAPAGPVYHPQSQSG